MDILFKKIKYIYVFIYLFIISLYQILVLIILYVFIYYLFFPNMPATVCSAIGPPKRLWVLSRAN